MTQVIADISMSLDGYVAAPGVDQEHGLGIGGEAIHAWALDEPRSPVDELVLRDGFERTGAVVMGRDRGRQERRRHGRRRRDRPEPGGGTRLFDLVGPTTLIQQEVIESPRATHLTYQVVRDRA